MVIELVLDAGVTLFFMQQLTGPCLIKVDMLFAPKKVISRKMEEKILAEISLKKGSKIFHSGYDDLFCRSPIAEKILIFINSTQWT